MMDITDIRLISFLFLPILSFVILIFFGNKINEKSHYVALPIIGLTLFNAIILLFESISHHHIDFKNSFIWFTTGDFYVSLGYMFDNITVIMLLVVSLISFLVHLY